MLSFEDFFSKKKINLDALKIADKPLYDEFKAHYQLMGEKSFDHTKKFWFNKLRKSFLLEENVIEEKETKKTSTPNFKAKITKSVESTDSNEGKIIENDNPDQVKTESTKPAGFKPRFKAGVTKPVESADVNEGNTSGNENPDQANTESTKPAGFKPRFKAGITKPVESADVNEGNTSGNEDPDQAKSAPTKPAGFKPRFKAGVTKTNNKD